MSPRDLIGRIGSRLVSLLLRRPGDLLASRLFFLGLRPGGKQQSGMLILTDIEQGKEGALHGKLEGIRKKLRDNRNFSLQNTKTVHYAAWMILPGVRSEGKPPGPAKLAFETNYDGSLAEHLEDLVKYCRDELDEVYGFSPGYPSPKSGASLVKEFLCANFHETSRSVNSTAYYVALPGRSLKDIRNAIAVYDEAKDFVDNLPKACCDPNAALIDHYKKKRAKVPPERFGVTQKGLRGLFVINMAVLTVLCLVVPIVLYLGRHWLRGLKGLFAISMVVLTLLCLMPLLYLARWLLINLIARYYECNEERTPDPFDPTGHDPEYAHLDLGRQNHLCTFTTVKPGWFRMCVIKRALWLGPVLFKYFFILGKLDQMTTVHFARWTLIGQQLIFYGNYDGSWSSYLSDFSDEAWGVNLVWGNTIGFPPTRFLVGRGARDLEGFQAQAAKHYAPAPVFYSAYPNRSLVNLLRYLEFRDGLL